MKNTMKTKHTPGPWQVRQNDCVYARGRLIADCEVTAYDKRPAPPNHQDTVNAKLVAAAPDLLEALQRLQMATLGYTHRNEIVQTALDSAQAAIAKATD